MAFDCSGLTFQHVDGIPAGTVNMPMAAPLSKGPGNLRSPSQSVRRRPHLGSLALARGQGTFWILALCGALARIGSRFVRGRS